ncbi:hypothetical protein HKI87_05g34520 [Chloropicon roscoffensis]|uniref:Uncharacterized protein n=1 Tax=Chloropicon roscoffensis TaxID=1461544 RepID=A0AAX4P775_9CHLO
MASGASEVSSLAETWGRGRGRGGRTWGSIPSSSNAPVGGDGAGDGAGGANQKPSRLQALVASGQHHQQKQQPRIPSIATPPHHQCTTNGCGSQPVDCCAGSWGGYGSCYHDNGDLDIGTYMRTGSMAHGSAGSFFGSHYSNTAMQAYWLRPFPGVHSPPASAAPAVNHSLPQENGPQFALLCFESV